MKKRIIGILLLLALCVLLTGCDSSTSTSYRSSGSSSASSNGYGNPKPGESFSDYVKREAPDLYNDMQDRYNSLTGGN